MNLSELITRIKADLGLPVLSTPFENIDERIANTILNTTRPVFSIFNPMRDRINVRTHDLELVERGSFYEKYNLPDFKDRKLLYVFDCNYDTESLTGLGYYGGGMPFMEGGLMNQTMLANAGAHVMNYMLPKLTFEFQHPRQITFYNIYSSSRIVIDLGFEHDRSLASIPPTASESFYELAELDVKKELLPVLKPYDEIQTPIGTVKLDLSDWGNPAEERKEYIRQWEDTYQEDIGPLVYYI